MAAVRVNIANCSPVQLAPNAGVDVPVDIVATTPMAAGKTASVVVTASSFQLLTSDKNPKDKHPEFKTLGGVRVEGHAVEPSKIRCTAVHDADGVVFQGILNLPAGQTIDAAQRTVFLDGLDPAGGFLPKETGHAYVAPDGTFGGVVIRGKFDKGVCMFAGTDTVSSAMSSPVAVR